ncbi:MAG: DUF4431 domain-containing protein [Zoogloeaceae bacterium]|jgi:hypothetical protein|nr:DUF4431 domain-containing protein [Zoogloeaceae bacterium]
MKLLRVFVSLFFLLPALCMGAEIYCGKVEKLFFSAPDDPPDMQTSEAIMLNFGAKKSVAYESLMGEHLSTSVGAIQLVATLDGQDGVSIAELVRLVGKHACFTGETMQSHTAHHIPPVLLTDLRRVDKTGDSLAVSGEFTATGMLQIYWRVNWQCEKECQPERVLQMRFSPDEQSLARLPLWQDKDQAVIQPKMIDILNSKPLTVSSSFPEKDIRALLKDVENMPENFFKYRERFVLFPATVRFSNFSASIECDTWHTAATFLEVKDIPGMLPEQETGVKKFSAACGLTPYDETFIITARTGKHFAVSASPDATSRVSARLENGTQALKIRTINDNWLYIQAVPGNHPYAADAKNPAVFGYLYKPAVMLEAVN